MSVFVLDTDILTLYREGHALVCQRIDAQPAAALAITVMSVEEQLSGWYTMLRRARQPPELARAYQRLGTTVQFLARWPILPFTEAAIARYDQLRGMKLNVAKMDLRIAAITLGHAATLVTRNGRDFQRIPNLPTVNWAI